MKYISNKVNNVNFINKVDFINKSHFLNSLKKNANAKILDIGCNDGTFTKQIADIVGTENIFGIEISKEAAEKSRLKNIDVTISDVEDVFPFEDETFDLVVSNQVIEHTCNTDHFIKEIYRVLSKNGEIVISTANLASFHNIFALLLGYQPFIADVSDEFCCGNPLNPFYGKKTDPKIRHHRRLFTSKSLKELFEFHGFKVESSFSSGFHFLPYFIQKYIKFSRYGIYLTIIAFKKQ